MSTSSSTAPEVITTAAEMRSWSRKQRLAGKRVGFVPTMGCLHAGHLSLVDLARTRADVVVVSIYVNPTQFAAHEDFGRYPRTRESDRASLASKGVEAVFEPETLYYRAPRDNDTATGGGEISNVFGAVPEEEASADSHDTFVVVERLSRGLCSLSRPHFFRGVATVVAKLFNVVEPDVAAFGEKDWQQLAIVKRMARDLDFAVEVLGGEIVREGDGLALSSRNELLAEEDREKAPCIYAALLEAKETVKRTAGEQGSPAATAGEVAQLVTRRLEGGGSSRVDYVSVVDAESLSPVPDETPISSRRGRRMLVAVAAFFGQLRLIDNMVVWEG